MELAPYSPAMATSGVLVFRQRGGKALEGITKNGLVVLLNLMLGGMQAKQMGAKVFKGIFLDFHE